VGMRRHRGIQGTPVASQLFALFLVIGVLIGLFFCAGMNNPIMGGSIFGIFLVIGIILNVLSKRARKKQWEEL
jgi:hypothetical protein